MENIKRRIHIGADAAGVELKAEFKRHLEDRGHKVIDYGAHTTETSHYPAFAAAVSEAVQADLDGSFGILICGTGIGMSMAANKHRGIRAAVCGDTFSARMTRIHNNANVLCIGARVTGPSLALDILDAFMSADFEDGGRHSLRVGMIDDIEKTQSSK